MTDRGLVSWLTAGALGVLLGACFYGGLWWTVRRALLSPRPGLWFVASLVLRSVVALGGVYVIGGTQWQRMLMCLLGFVVARPLVVRLTRRSAATATCSAAKS